MIKGWFFIFCTALILYMLIGRFTTRIIRSEETSRKSERGYRGLFEDSPTSLWEEDFSAIKKYLGRLRDSGIIDFRDYFENHPETVQKCAEMVKIVDVNRATLEMFHAESKKDLLKNYRGFLAINRTRCFGRSLALWPRARKSLSQSLLIKRFKAVKFTSL